MFENCFYFVNANFLILILMTRENTVIPAFHLILSKKIAPECEANRNIYEISYSVSATYKHLTLLNYTIKSM